MGHARKHRIGLPHRALAAQGQLGIQRGLFRLASALSTCHCQDGCVSSLVAGILNHPPQATSFVFRNRANHWSNGKSARARLIVQLRLECSQAKRGVDVSQVVGAATV